MEKSTQTFEIISESEPKAFNEDELLKFAKLFQYDKQENINKLNEKLLAPYNYKELYSEDYYREKFKGFPSNFYNIIANAEGFVDKRIPNLQIRNGNFRPFEGE